MSESAGASAGSGASSAGSAGASQSTSSANTQASTGQATGAESTSQQRSWGSSGGGQSSNPNPNANSQTDRSKEPAAESADDFEEIALGSVKGKVPKTLAKAIKDFERGAQKRMEEAARARQDAQERDQLLSLLEQDPDAFAKKYSERTKKPFDLDTFAEERLAKKYELMAMSPEQRELHEARQQLEAHKKSELQSKQGVIDEIKQLMGPDAPGELENYPKEQLQAYAAQQRQAYEQTQASLNQEIIEAWQDSGLPKHKYFGALMSFQMMSHIQQNKGQENFQPLHAKEAAAKVKTDFMRSVQEIVSQMDPQGIQELLGKDVLTKLRTFDIDRVTAKAASHVGQGPRPGYQPASESPKQVNQFEWRKAMGLD